MELKLAKEGTEYILGLPMKAATLSQVINYSEGGTIESYLSLEEAKQARDELAKELDKPILIYERITRRLK